MSEQQQEMYDEINVLIASLGKAFKVEGEIAAKAVETGEMTLNLGVDKDGDKFVEATYKGEVAYIYPGSAKEHMTTDEIKVEGEA